MGDALPSKYKAAIYDQPGEISTKVVELDMPEPAAGDVLIKLYANTMMVLPLNQITGQGLTHFPVPIQEYATVILESC